MLRQKCVEVYLYCHFKIKTRSYAACINPQCFVLDKVIFSHNIGHLYIPVKI